MSTLQQPLKKAQLEILKLMARPMSDEDLKAIKRFIVQHFAKKLTARANKTWDANGWTEEDEKRLLHTHIRTPYGHNINIII
jgi:hypothetical protein